MTLPRRRFLASAAGAAAFAGLPRAAGAHAAEPDAAAAVPAPLPRARELEMQRFRTLATTIARANVVNGKPIPSHAYPQATWMRDAYWTLGALGDPLLQQRTFQRFAAIQDPSSGRVPTAVLNDDQPYYARDDESTAFFLLLALDLKRAGFPVDPAAVGRAGAYLQAMLDPSGSVVSPAGPFAWWLDTLILAQPDVVAYNQGVFTVALRALVELGVPPEPGTIERAEAAYAGLHRPDLGALTLSRKTTLLDVSCLVGEHLSLRYFDRALLSDEVVAGTLSRFRHVYYPDGAFLGFPVATQLDGSYMPEAWFHPAPDNWPGFYHNGGSWLLYDALALDAGRRHAVTDSAALLDARVASETRYAQTLNEYIATDGTNGYLGKVPFRWRTGYAWNAYVATLV